MVVAQGLLKHDLIMKRLAYLKFFKLASNAKIHGVKDCGCSLIVWFFAGEMRFSLPADCCYFLMQHQYVALSLRIVDQ